MLKVYNVACIGFGVVGQGLARILQEKKKQLADDYGIEFRLVAVSDLTRGSVYEPEGFDIEKLLQVVEKENSFESLSCYKKGLSSLDTIVKTNADIIAEATFTDITTGEPGLTHIRTALEHKKHVVTTNKGPVVLKHNELEQIAFEHGVRFLYEGTVLSGTPVFSLAQSCLHGCSIKSIEGILNGTTNYILSEMENGLDFDQALKQAKQLGYAEADPTADIEGKDALGKVIILANTFLKADLTTADVPCEGIKKVTLREIEKARAAGFRYKLIGTVEKKNEKVIGHVGLKKLPFSDSLAGVSGPVNALKFTTDLLGETTIVGEGAGKMPTGFALFSDMLRICK